MKQLFFKIFIFSVLILSDHACVQAAQNFAAKKSEKPVIEISEPSKELRVGEKLQFNVYWMGAHVGLGSLEIKEKVKVGDRMAYHVIAIARTNDFLSKIYPVTDEIHSYVDTEKFYSLKFTKTLKEGGYRADEEIVYDHANKKAFYKSLLNKNEKQFDIPEGVHDMVSSFYWFRTQSIAVGQSAKTLVNGEEKNWDMEIAVLESGQKELRGGKVINTLLVEPKSKYKGVLYKRGRALVTVTADAKRIPIKILLTTPFGPVYGVLDVNNVDTSL